MQTTVKHDVQSETPEAALDFLKKILPFNELDHDTLKGLARHCLVDFYPKGTHLLTANESEVEHLFLVQQGGFKSFITDDEGDITLKDYRGEGSSVGALGIIRGTLANLDVESVEDTFCILLPRTVFLDLIHKQPGFAQYYLRSFSEKIVHTAYSELRHHRMARRANDDLYLFSVAAGDIVKQKPVIAPTTTGIQKAASLMARFRVGSLLVHQPNDPEQIVGIITDRDLRSKVVAAGLDFPTSVETIMSSPVQTVLSRDICFDVLLKMMSTGIHHLAVERAGRIIGVITSHDIMLLQGHSPYYLFKKIIGQRNFSGLYPLAQKIPEVIRSLINEGGKAGNITRMIALLNDRILQRLLTLLEGELGPPPVPYCWLHMGSEGRREQTFKTDQDNAIIYADPIDDAQKVEAEAYFKELAQQAIDHLVNCGYPLCPGKIMANNPQWCQPVSVWQEYFTSWVKSENPAELLESTIFFDFRAGYGETGLADELRNHLIEQSRQKETYLLHLSRDCLTSQTALSFFNNFIVEKDGEHKNKLDLKHQGLAPLVDFARIFALKAGIKETNTLARFHTLGTEEVISKELMNSACEAYELQMQLRILHQLHQLENGTLPDNHIDPATLSELEKRMLKEAFHVIERLHSVLKDMFPGL